MAKDKKHDTAPLPDDTEFDDEGRIISGPTIPFSTPEMAEMWRARIEQWREDGAKLDEARAAWRRMEEQKARDKREERAANRALIELAAAKVPSGRKTPQAEKARRAIADLAEKGEPVGTMVVKTLHGKIADLLKADGVKSPYPSPKVVGDAQKWWCVQESRGKNRRV